MAKNKKTDGAAGNARVMESAAENGAAPEEVTDNVVENAAPGKDANNGVEDNEGREQAPAVGAKNAPQKNEGEQALESIAVLSAKHRLPGWQTAAIMRMMDWEDDVMVSDADFCAAIGRLNNRRIGGGRGV